MKQKMPKARACARCGTNPRLELPWCRHCEECKDKRDGKYLIITCSDCGKEKRHAANGQCYACYVYRRRKAGKARPKRLSERIPPRERNAENK